MEKLPNYQIDPIIQTALSEDIGQGDITTRLTCDDALIVKGELIAKEQGIICGLQVFARTFTLLDPAVEITFRVEEGDKVQKGTILADICGPARALLAGERVALNFLQRLSAIATCTARAAAQVRGSGAVITDTRKTTPGLRLLEKYAVRTGGGTNHRYNLSDGVLIKDNHIKAAGGLAAAVGKARAGAPHTMRIEVEAETQEQVAQALASGADIILLDNMELEQIKEAVKKIGKKALVEISGNMGQKDLAAVAAAGVDLISVGALTHTVKAMDLSLKLTGPG